MRKSWKHALILLLYPAFTVSAGGFAWYQLQLNLNEEQKDVEQRALRDSGSLARSYAASTIKFLQNIDQLALHVQFEWELAQHRIDLAMLYERGLFTSEPMINVTVVDKNGKPISSTNPYNSTISLANEPYFLSHKRGLADALFIGEPSTSRLLRQPTIEFSRNLSDPKTGFEGIVLVSVSPTYFTDGYDVATLEQHGLLAIINEHDHLLVARSGNSESRIGSPLMNVPDIITGSNGVASISGTQFADGRERYVGWQRIDDFNLIAIAGLDKAEVHEHLQRNRAYAERYAAWSITFLTLATVVAIFVTYRLQLRKSQIEEVRTTYRLATERGNEGFYMLRPTYRAGHMAATDFSFVDCNRRGAELYGLTQEALRGKSLSALLSSSLFREELSKMQRALDSGYLDEELQVVDGMPFRCNWLYRRIVRSDGGLAVTASDVSERKAYVRELERKGYEDALTGLRNRHWLNDSLPAAIEQAREQGTQMALMFIDLDHFKRINDGMGHRTGDELLRLCAERLVDVVRPEDKVVRLGGDEFLIMLMRVDGKEGAQHVAERIAAVLNRKFRLASNVLDVSASMGISLFPQDCNEAESLLHNADIAMYSAKSSGRAQWRFYDPHFAEEVKNRLRREKELTRAIEADEFTVYYQPRLEVHSGRVCSMEALVRWKHPQRGLVPPNEFIPLAEETGLIVALGEMVIRKVFSQMTQWTVQGRALVPVSINVSARQFNETDVRATLAAAFECFPVKPELIEVELTESSMTGDVAEVGRTIASIQNMGVKVLVDDFGTGYSSLAQLQKLDMDVLKVDRAFTLEIDQGREGRIFFSAIITMAHALGMRVVAEGVENATQVDILKDLDCDEIQGYFVSHPLTANALQEFLEHMRSTLPGMTNVNR